MHGKTTRKVAQIIGEKEERVNRELIDNEPEFELDVYGADNKLSVVNMLQGKVKELALAIPDQLKELTQDELRELVEPDGILTQLRLRLWYTYDEAAFAGKPIRVSTVAKGVCNPEIFKKIIMKPENLAFILCPIVNYEVQVQDFLETSLYKMRKGLDNVKIETSKDLLAVLKVYEVFDKRVNGDYKQVIKKEVKHVTEPKSSSEIRQVVGKGKDLLIE